MPVTVVLSVGLAAFVSPAPAYADPTDAQIREARDLFAQAEKDEDGGRWADALGELRRVFTVKQTAGVRYHIALCQEQLGHLVDALHGFTDALAAAQAENARDVVRFTSARLAELEPRVPRLTVTVTPDVPDTTIALDGDPIAHAIVGSAIPVDPGAHHVEARAPSRAPSDATITLAERDALSVHLTLPELALAAPPPAAPAPVPGAMSTEPATRSSPALAIGATGAAAVLAGAGFAAFLAGGHAHTTAVDQCRPIVSASPEPCSSLKQSYRTWDWLAAGAWAGAAAATTVAVVLWTRRSSRGPASSSASVVVIGPSLTLRGAF